MSSSNKQINHNIFILPELGRILAHSGSLGVKWRQWLEHWECIDAATNLEHDDSQLSNRYCCHCVELIPDHAGILVKRAIRVEPQCERLLNFLNDHFGDRDFKFEISEGKLWLDTRRTLPNGWKNIGALIGNNLFQGLGKSREFSYWLSIINEVQMLLASSDSDFPFNGLWVSEDPARINQSLSHTGHIVLFDPVGLEHWIYGEQEALDVWLEKCFEQVTQLVRSNENLLIHDGEHQWTIKSSDSLIRRLIRFFRKG